MVMSITLALQQKHQDEQNSLCNAVKLLMQSPGYIQVFVKKKKQQQATGRNLVFNPHRLVVIGIGSFAGYSVSYSHHGQHISQEEV